MSDSAARPSYRLDHVCFAVRRIEAARKTLERTLGYVARTEPVENTRQQVRVQFMSKEGSLDIKLIEPSTPESPLIAFLQRSGGGLHHLAFRTDSVTAAVDDLSARGARIVTPPEPGEAFEEHLISFVLLGSGLNVELVDTDLRRSEYDSQA